MVLLPHNVAETSCYKIKWLESGSGNQYFRGLLLALMRAGRKIVFSTEKIGKKWKMWGLKKKWNFVFSVKNKKLDTFKTGNF